MGDRGGSVSGADREAASERRRWIFTAALAALLVLFLSELWFR